MKYLSIILLSFLFIGCAQKPSKVMPSYVSETNYTKMNCVTLNKEVDKNNINLDRINSKQDSAYVLDMWTVGVGVVIFPPVLLFLLMDDYENELATLKGEQKALNKVSKKCKKEQR